MADRFLPDKACTEIAIILVRISVRSQWRLSDFRLRPLDHRRLSFTVFEKFSASQAIDLMDEAGSRARIEAYMARMTTGGNAPPQRQPWQELAQVMQAKTEAVKVRSVLA